MNVVPFRNTDLFIRGHRGELVVQQKLLSEGCFVIPSYDYNRDDKSPRMIGNKGHYILPDLDVSAHGFRFWAEVKLKREPTLYRNWNRWEHGIPLRHYHHYLKVSEITGCPVYLFVIEEKDDVILYAELNEIDRNARIYDGPKMSRGGMIFFDRQDFSILT